MDKDKFKDSKGGIKEDVGDAFDTKRNITSHNYKNRPDLEKHHEKIDNNEMDGD